MTLYPIIKPVLSCITKWSYYGATVPGLFWEINPKPNIIGDL